MSKYLLIESRDPFESRDTAFLEQTATDLRQRGHEVVVFLVQNGVLAVRQNSQGSYLSRLASANVTLLADNFSLQERGIKPVELQAGIELSGIEELVDALTQENTKAIWH